MTANPIDTVIVDSVAVPKANVRGWGKQRVAQVIADADELRNLDLSGQLVVILKANGRTYALDTSDTTTADDGLSCIVSQDGFRFKLTNQSGVVINAAGPLADRSDYDSEATGFTYFASDTELIYVRLAAGGWSAGTPLTGPTGATGDSFFPDYVVQLIADRDAYDSGPAVDPTTGRRLSVLVTADSTNLDVDSNPLPTLYFLISAATVSPSAAAVWSDGFTFTVPITETHAFNFTGDGTTVAFDLGVTIRSVNHVIWIEDGIWQRPSIDFTVSGSVVTRSAPPPNGAIISGVLIVVSDVTGLGAAFDAKVNVSDIDTDSTMAANSDTKVASQKATKTALATKPTATLDTDGTLAANSDTRVPSQKAVKTYADQLIAAADAMVFKGVIDCSANPNYPAADRGWTYKVSVAGKIGGASGVNVEAGDTLLCITDGTASGNQATVGSAWSIVQTNLDGAVIGPASATDSDFAQFNGTTGKLLKGGLALDTDGTLAANSDTKVASQKAVKTYADTKIAASLLTTRGDIITRGASAPQRLALGANGYVLTSNGTDAVWAAGGGVGSPAAWTPTLTAATTPGTPTYSNQSGTYLQIGKLVIATFDVGVSAWSGSPAGYVRMSLPVNNNGVAGCGGFVNYVNGLTWTAGYTQLAPAAASSTQYEFEQLGSGGFRTTQITDINTSTFRIQGTLIYFAP